MIELNDATKLVIEMGEFRNNEAIRQADLISREVAK